MIFYPWLTHEGTEVRRHASGAYTYTTSYMSLDADGSPQAYHPADYPSKGLDLLRHAGYPDKSWPSVLATDPADRSKPFVQPDGPFAGFFVSKTSLQDKVRRSTDPERYVNAEIVPYIVFPGNFYRIPGTGGYGDLAMMRNLDNGAESFAVIADGARATAPLGEVSLKLAANLSHDPATLPNAKTGGGKPSGRFQTVIFPRSRATPPWPRSVDEMEATARLLLASIGGWPEHGQPVAAAALAQSAKWDLRIQRHSVQVRGGERRTVGSYELWVEGVRQIDIFGTTAEPGGPGDNTRAGKLAGSRIAEGRYPLFTQDGTSYDTVGYSEIVDSGTFPMPGLQLGDTGARREILIHPGKDRFLSSVGCINLCARLPDAAERIDFPGSRRRVIALIENLKRVYARGFPEGEGRFANAWVTVMSEPE